ncbi:MAG: hypothetical protein R3E86_01745 [Pseudomonadales bacterium]
MGYGCTTCIDNSGPLRSPSRRPSRCRGSGRGVGALRQPPSEDGCTSRYAPTGWRLRPWWWPTP